MKEKNEFSGTVYHPTDENYPMLAILFKNGEIITHREVSSVEEGNSLIDEAVQTLPTLE